MGLSHSKMKLREEDIASRLSCFKYEVRGERYD